MEKTTYYQLNRPEAADPIRVSDFNENAEIIDAALKQVDDNSVTRSAQVRSEAASALAAYKTTNDAAVAAKAEQSEVNGLNTTVTALNTLLSTKARLEIGSYKGNGGRGSANKNTLTFGFEPGIVGIVIDAKDISNGAALFIRGQSKCSGTCKDALDLIINWSGNTVTWYDDSNGAASEQLNSEAYTYFYFAIG